MKFIIPVAAVLLAVILSACDIQTDQTESSQLEQSSQTTFIDEQSCMGCHKQEFNDWKGSHHALAMDVASDETVLGDFNRAEFSLHGVTSRFFKREGRFFVHTDGKDGKLQDFEVSYVFGVEPLQQYLIKFPDGRMQALDIAWDTRSKENGGQRWFHLHPDEKISAKHPFHWTKPLLNWNYMCAECHSTGLKKNFNLKSNTFNTTWHNINVSCQACHGPGSDHVTWANSKTNARDKSVWKENRGFGLDLAGKNAGTQVKSCARCHARRSNVSDQYEFGKPFMDFYQPQVLREPFYHPDGQIRDEVYVYGSFVQSKKFARGVKCTDCHNAHTSRLRFKGNNLCISCHNNALEKPFEGLKQKVYDTPMHHFHKAGSKGAQCISCHMPEKLYMGVDARNDHSFRIPRPDLSLKINTPNACIQCHQNQSDEWAAETVSKWYPASVEKYKQATHFSEFFAAAQSPAPTSPATAAGLIQIATEPKQANIVKATAISLLAAYPGMETVNVLRNLLKHKDSLIRYHAVHSLDRLIPKAAGEPMLHKKLTMFVPLLTDPIRAVRTEAARALSDIPEAMFSRPQYAQFKQSLAEYAARQQAIEDRPESHLNMGLVHQRMGKTSDAESAYKTAIRLAPDDLPSRFNLASLYHVQGNNAQAEAVFREIISIDADNGEAFYSLGLLLAELGRLNDAASTLHHAATLMPKRTRVRYNYALVLKKQGKDPEAIKNMLKVVDVNTTEAMMVYVLTTWLAEAKQYDAALLWAKKLVELVPNEDGAKHLLIDIRNRKLMNQ